MRSILVLILVVEAALVCAAHSKETTDFSKIKLRHVEPGLGRRNVAATDDAADPDDNRARIIKLWGIKLKPADRDPVLYEQQTNYDELNELVSDLEDGLKSNGCDRELAAVVRMMMDRADKLVPKIGDSIDAANLRDKLNACKLQYREFCTIRDFIESPIL